MGRGGQNMLYGDITGFNAKHAPTSPDSSWSAIAEEEYKLTLPDLALDNQTKVLDSNFISQPALTDYREKLIYSSSEYKKLFSVQSDYSWTARDGQQFNWDNIQLNSKLASSKHFFIEQDILYSDQLTKGDLIPIYFNLLSLEDAQDSKLFFYPQGEPHLNSYNSETQNNIREFVAYVNRSQTIINSGAVAAVEKTAGNKFGSWYYNPYRRDRFFHLYYLSNRRNVIGSLKANKPVDFC
jgi:hypothetical protein